MPATRVPDASVIAAIVFDEPRADEAASLLDGMDLSAPSLLAYELTNIARTKARQRPERIAEVEQSLSKALSLNIRSVDVDHGSVLRLALEKGLTAYDASYLYVARLLDAPLVTFDQRLGAAAHSP